MSWNIGQRADKYGYDYIPGSSKVLEYMQGEF